ncbi:MAG: N-acetylneuraminate synthase family protein [Treponema sp.]|nr:N-acetylneuraminate synthase family protein [Treponema sp.]
MTIIAEIGTAHNGSLEKAYELIDAACQAGADMVKFQWVYADEILHPNTGFVTLPGGKIRLYDRFKSLEVPQEFFAKCLEYAHKNDMLFACSPFGLRSLKELVQIKPDAIKIASPEVNHIPLLKATASYYRNIPIILSSGVSKLGDIEKAINILENEKETSQKHIPVFGNKKLSPLTLLHCITFYPAPETEYNVRCVDTLHRVFGIPAGISDHSLDSILIPVLSTAMGGTMIEKHITLSRKTDGLDDPVALEPEQFSMMVHAVHQTIAVIGRFTKDDIASRREENSAIEEIIRQMSNEYGKEKVMAALGTGIKRLAKSELANYGRTNRSLHFMNDMKKGQTITEQDISVLRTEKILTPGIAPDYFETVIGAALKHDVKAGDGVQWEQML